MAKYGLELGVEKIIVLMLLSFWDCDIVGEIIKKWRKNVLF